MSSVPFAFVTDQGESAVSGYIGAGGFGVDVDSVDSVDGL